MIQLQAVATVSNSNKQQQQIILKSPMTRQIMPKVGPLIPNVTITFDSILKELTTLIVFQVIQIKSEPSSNQVLISKNSVSKTINMNN